MSSLEIAWLQRMETGSRCTGKGWLGWATGKSHGMLYRWLSSKESPVGSRHKRCGFYLKVGKIPWKRKCLPLQYFCLENPMARGTWWVHGVAKSQTQPSTHTLFGIHSRVKSWLHLLCFCLSLFGSRLWLWIQTEPLSLMLPLCADQDPLSKVLTESVFPGALPFMWFGLAEIQLSSTLGQLYCCRPY